MNTLENIKNFSITESDILFFKRNGYLLCENFLTKEESLILKNKINKIFDSKEAIDVLLYKSTFRTINGSTIDNNIPEITSIYDNTIHKIVGLINNNMFTLVDRKIGVSINKTSKGNNFQAHFDRNLITAVIYVGDQFKGGTMLIHPRVRILLKNNTKYSILRKAQLFFDKVVKTPIYLKFFSRSIEITPKVGTLLIFEGSKTLHEVKPVLEGDRISIQLAYDKFNKIYQSTDYYGAIKNDLEH